jgi:uncharacterized membrane protein YraQ (UPF0718 family)
LELQPQQQAWSRDWWASLLRESFGPMFWGFAAFAVLMAALCYGVLGTETFNSAVARDLQMITDLLPRIAAAQVVAGLAWFMLPRDRLSRMLKKTGGRRGLAMATVAGIITPGGPMAAFPFTVIIANAGADRGVLVAYLASWALLGMQRIIVWDLPFMGAEFSTLRFLISLPMPIVAGMIARRLPFSVSLEKITSGESLRQ